MSLNSRDFTQGTGIEIHDRHVFANHEYRHLLYINAFSACFFRLVIDKDEFSANLAWALLLAY